MVMDDSIKAILTKRCSWRCRRVFFTHISLHTHLRKRFGRHEMILFIHVKDVCSLWMVEFNRAEQWH